MRLEEVLLLPEPDPEPEPEPEFEPDPDPNPNPSLIPNLTRPEPEPKPEPEPEPAPDSPRAPLACERKAHPTARTDRQCHLRLGLGRPGSGVYVQGVTQDVRSFG